MANQKRKSTSRADDLTTEESAIMLKKAFSKSDFPSLKKLADKLGFNYKTLGNYFSGHRRPSQERLEIILMELAHSEKPTLLKYKVGAPRPIYDAGNGTKNTCESERHAHLLKCAIALAMEQLDFFKEGSNDDRIILRKVISGKDAGYFTSLWGSLYNEEQLKAWKAFSELRRDQ